MAVQSLTTRVAWVDTDAGGRIHHTAAFRWAELAEIELFRRLGLLDEWRQGRFPRRVVHAEFSATLRFDDELLVELRVDRVGRTSITYRWEVMHGGTLAVEGSHTVVHVDVHGAASEVPASLRDALESS
jgi:YbgC/YbaW family acyl-CoA thioester hydrolase